MTWADCVNGGYEFIGGFLLLNHCRCILKHKAVAGVSILSVFIFNTWGFWNLFYYPHLGQWISFSGGLWITTTNTLYVYLLWKYRKGFKCNQQS